MPAKENGMEARSLGCLAIALAAMASLPAVAQTEAQAQPCRVPGPASDPLGDREALLAQFERLPQSCLQEIFRACSDVSNRSLLDFGSAATCSFGYEALLKHGFGGNFHALMAWWSNDRGTTRR
jgi:hypothetical protein